MNYLRVKAIATLAATVLLVALACGGASAVSMDTSPELSEQTASSGQNVDSSIDAKMTDAAGILLRLKRHAEYLGQQQNARLTTNGFQRHQLPPSALILGQNVPPVSPQSGAGAPTRKPR